MKRGLKIVLVVLAVLVVALAAIAVWQKDNIKALFMLTKYSPAQLEEKLKDNNSRIEEVLDSHPEITVRDLTDEEKEALRNGEIDPEELVEILTSPDGPKEDESAGQSADTAAPSSAGQPGTEQTGQESDKAPGDPSAAGTEQNAGNTGSGNSGNTGSLAESGSSSGSGSGATGNAGSGSSGAGTGSSGTGSGSSGTGSGSSGSGSSGTGSGSSSSGSGSYTENPDGGSSGRMDDPSPSELKPLPSAAPESPSPEPGQGGFNSGERDAEKEVAELLARAYVLRAEFTGKIDSLVAEAKAEYLALDKSERTSSAKTSIGMKYLSKATSLESQCDAQMNAIISELQGVITNTGGDESIVDTVKETYESEKSATKAYYLSLAK